MVVSSASSFATVCFLLLVLQALGLSGAGTPNVVIAIAAADGAATTSFYVLMPIIASYSIYLAAQGY